MRVLVFTSDLYSGGVAESTRKIVRFLEEEGNDVLVVTYDWMPIRKKVNSSVIRLRMPLSVGFADSVLSRILVKTLRAPCILIAVVMFILIRWYWRPETSYSLTYVPNLVNAIAGKIGIAPGRTVLSERQDPRMDSIPKFLRPALRWAYRNTDRVHTNSLGMTHAMRAEYDIPMNKIIEVPNFFYLDEVNSLANKKHDMPVLARDRPFLLCCGRMSKQKGFWHAILAAKLLADRGLETSFDLVLIGSGPLEGELKELAKDQGISDRVHFIDDLDNPFPYFLRAKCLLFPSVWESFGNVLVEAMALGVPVIASNCHSGPAQILLDGVYGVLLPPAPPYAGTARKSLDSDYAEDIAKAVEALSEPAYFTVAKQKALEGAQRFSVDTLRTDIRRIFSKG